MQEVTLLRRRKVPPEVMQAFVGAKQRAEDGGVCEEHVTRTISRGRHPEEHVEFRVPFLRERVRL